MRRAEKCNDAYWRQTTAACGVSVCVCARARECRCQCLTTYAGEPLLFPYESAYVAADEEAFEKRLRSTVRERARERKLLLFFQVFPSALLPRPHGHASSRAHARSGFSLRRSETEAPLLPLFPHAKALITSFRVRRRGHSLLISPCPPAPRALILVRENAVRPGGRFIRREFPARFVENPLDVFRVF